MNVVARFSRGWLRAGSRHVARNRATYDLRRRGFEWLRAPASAPVNEPRAGARGHDPRAWGRRRLPELIVLAAILLPCAMRAADPTRQLVGELLAPDRISQVTLSPDGRRLAYVVRDGTVVSLVIRQIDPPPRKTVVRAEADERRGVLFRSIGFRVRFPYVAWARDDALVYLVQLPPKDRGFNEELHVVDAEGNHDLKLMDSDDAEGTYQPLPPAHGDEMPEMPPPIPVPRHIRVLGVDPSSPNLVMIEAVGTPRVESEISRIELTTGNHDRVDHHDGVGRYLSDIHGFACVRETARVFTPLPVPMSGRGAMMPPDGPTLQRQRFDVRTRSGGGWRALDTLVGRDAKLQFSHDDSDFYAHRSIPLAVNGDGSVLYFASNVGRDTFGIYALDTATGHRTPLAVENAVFDLVDPADAMSGRVLVFDRQRRLQGVRMPGWPARTTWFDSTLAGIQAKAEARFENRSVRLLEWSEDRTRALLLVGGPMEPGRYFIVTDRPSPRFTEVLRRLPGLDASRVARAEPFAFATPAGVRLTGTVVVPRHARVNPPPLVVVCRDIPGRAADLAAFDRSGQALAAQGFMVLQVNYRGTAGLGIQHRDAVRAGFDRVPLEDVHAALGWLATQHPFDRRRVALLGTGFGGFIALRGLELFPAEFRCAVVIDAPADPAAWATDPGVQPLQRNLMAPPPPPIEPVALRRTFFADESRRVRDLESISVLRNPAALQRPVLILDRRERTFEARPQGEKLRAALKKAGQDPQYGPVPDAVAGGDAEGAARVFTQIGDFLNANLFEYGVRIGPERPVEDAPRAPADTTP